MNQYGKALEQDSVQTLLPAMTEDGRVWGFYPIAETTFDGTETGFEVEAGVTVPVKTVTVDTDTYLHSVTQYVAAVWPIGLAINYFPWASSNLIAKDDGYYRWYSMPTETWTTHFGKGVVIEAIQNNLNTTVPEPVAPVPPDVVDGSMEWRASVNYTAMSGPCSFFDFNWMDVFQAKSTKDPVRIVVVSNPAPISPETVPPMKATIVGIPQASGNGVLYNTIRIMKLTENLLPQAYTFEFEVVDSSDNRTSVEFTLTVL
jgi:hypothetical protein